MAAAVSTGERIIVRAPAQGEGAQIATLWRELWDVHERWGGYPAARDARVYTRLALRLDDDARVRGGQPVLGRHLHLIAAVHGQVCGQVEGWFDRHGVEPRTPYTCEVRSLIVHPRMRAMGVGRALLAKLGRTASDLGLGHPAVLAAEVLEPNPAHSFYERLGFRRVSWTTRMMVTHEPRPRGGEYTARLAQPRDALALAVLESMLASRRRSARDERYDRPRAIDATLVGAIAAHLGRVERDPSDPMELVTVDRRGDVRAAASLLVTALDPPFARTRRTLLDRFAIDPAREPLPVLAPLVALACRLAMAAEAPAMELTDLTCPGTPLYEATLRLGAQPWSRVVTRPA